jgi:putative transposase
LPETVVGKRALIEPEHPELSLRRQCELVGLNRSSWYYQPARESPLNLLLMRLLDEQYTRTPFYGWPRMTTYLQDRGYPVNHKRVQRLLRKMGLVAVYPQPRTTLNNPEHRVYPYRLRDLVVTQPNQVWCADITYIRLTGGFMYLVAIMDWFSRYILTWELSNTLDGHFCLSALRESLRHEQPAIFNTDQGAQFTATAFTTTLEQADVLISMDGRGRAMDNIFIERFWRTLKYEDIYLKEYADVPALFTGLTRYMQFYNHERRHQSLKNCTPAQVYFGR